MDRPPPDPRKLLDEWMEWERGETTPGRVMANLKTAGLRDILEVLVARGDHAVSTSVTTDAQASADTDASAAWTPTV
jgi:hypothetical protein